MGLDLANSKVREICDLVLKETLEPAKEEARRCIEDAKKEAARILDEAHRKALQIEEENKKRLEKEFVVHEASVQLAVNKGLARLKELVMNVFSTEIEHLLELRLEKEDVIADLINALVSSIEKEGLKANLQVLIPQKVSLPVVQGKLLQIVRDRLGHNGIKLGDFTSGCVLKIIEKKMSIEITGEAVKELLATYLDDLKEKLFSK